MIFLYFAFSISITFLSWIIAMLTTPALSKTKFYKNDLSNLNFIKNEKLNQILGIDAIRWITINTFFKIFNPRIKMQHQSAKNELNRMRNEMTKSEVDHLIGFLYVNIFVLIKFLNNEPFFAIVIFFVNVLMNLYPSLLQQKNKRRIDKLLRNYS